MRIDEAKLEGLRELLLKVAEQSLAITDELDDKAVRAPAKRQRGRPRVMA